MMLNWIIDALAWMALAMAAIGFVALLVVVIWLLWLEIRDIWRDDK